MTQGRVIFIAFCLTVTLSWVAVAAADVPWEQSFADGVRAYQAGDWLRAAEHLERCQSTTVDSQRQRQALFYLAEVYVQLGNLSQARQLYESFVELMPHDPQQVTVIRARFRLGEMSFLLRDDDRCERELRDFLTEYPDDALADHATRYLKDLATRQSVADPVVSSATNTTRPSLQSNLDVMSELAARRDSELDYRQAGHRRQADREAARIKVLEAFWQDQSLRAVSREPGP